MTKCRFCSAKLDSRKEICPECGRSQYESIMTAESPFFKTSPPPQMPVPAAPAGMQVQQKSPRQIVKDIMFFLALAAIPVLVVLVIVSSRSVKPVEHTAGDRAIIMTPENAQSGSLELMKDYYDVVEELSYTPSYGGKVEIKKVLAKQDCVIERTIVFYGKDEKVCGRDLEYVTLAEGEYNYFKTTFDKDLPEDAKPEYTERVMLNKFEAARNAVEMTEWKQDERNLYLTFRQNAEPLERTTGFKLLLYKEGALVKEQSGFFADFVPELNAVGSEGTAEILKFGQEFDEVEYFYEP